MTGAAEIARRVQHRETRNRWYMVAPALVVVLLAAIGPLLIMVASLAGDEFKLKEVIVNIVVLTIGSWAIFIKGLNLVIPLWPAFMTA